MVRHHNGASRDWCATTARHLESGAPPQRGISRVVRHHGEAPLEWCATTSEHLESSAPPRRGTSSGASPLQGHLDTGETHYRDTGTTQSRHGNHHSKASRVRGSVTSRHRGRVITTGAAWECVGCEGQRRTAGRPHKLSTETTATTFCNLIIAAEHNRNDNRNDRMQLQSVACS